MPPGTRLNLQRVHWAQAPQIQVLLLEFTRDFYHACTDLPESFGPDGLFRAISHPGDATTVLPRTVYENAQRRLANLQGTVEIACFERHVLVHPMTFLLHLQRAGER